MPKKMQLPPQIPQSKDELERAVSLLGNRIQADLRSKPAQELVALLGHYPSPEEATVWKQSLKQMTRPKRQRYGENNDD
ncbi:hypothetical protein [Chlorogloea sp. CCALA 695]|uniref:hypothetical protein n=1 Tax=Chlorogloea sp. CCALA 695 TaxID=2107693 RepID=UPI000D058602|nr:hypothetical protein [Chlorogloea sp. CCALA 695]PSB31364.1 hypothetical protein C7B70_13615 [Chlorogloea sp. CCALA 695]